MGNITTLDQVMKEWAESSKPKIKLKLSHGTGPNWILTLEEVFPNEDRYPYHTTSSLDDKVIWTVAQLEKWPNCTRLAWNMWRFKEKKDAAKFMTLFRLKWLA